MSLYIRTATLYDYNYMDNTYGIILFEFVLEVIIRAQDSSVVMIKWEILLLDHQEGVQ